MHPVVVELDSALFFSILFPCILGSIGTQYREPKPYHMQSDTLLHHLRRIKLVSPDSILAVMIREHKLTKLVFSNHKGFTIDVVFTSPVPCSEK
ncbi:hypothetical protein EDB87DRAFT_1642021 [Lactarius vividus]|nr:hypothetical protein EDB87DRAFT_1642021 [Lactarius vividus]